MATAIVPAMQQGSVRRIGFWAGIAMLAVVLGTEPAAGLDLAAWRALGVAALMACWWLTEALPITATALVPLVAFPLLGIMPITATSAPYANPVVFLFLGGFMLARSLEVSHLHRRLSLGILSLFGTRPAGIVGGFMVATAGLSMWINNTATVAMMAPLALSVAVVGEAEDGSRRGFATALLLGVAWSSSLGGIATLVGTAPNALLAGFAAETLGRTISFAGWLALGLPVLLVSLPITWWLLVRMNRLATLEATHGAEWLDERRRELGPWSRHEQIVAGILSLTGAAWICSSWLKQWIPALSDAGIAICGVLALLMVPVSAERRALSWHEAEEIPWSVLLLVGGGLSLAVAIDDRGLAAWIGSSLSALGTPPVWVMVAAVTTLVVFLTELTSNTATAAAMLPVAASIATAAGYDPLLLAAPAAIAASCAFMLPVATPPNAIVFASGKVPLHEMARQGWRLNLLLIVIITAATVVGIERFGS